MPLGFISQKCNWRRLSGLCDHPRLSVMFDFQNKALQEPQKERVGKKKKKRGQEAKESGGAWHFGRNQGVI